MFPVDETCVEGSSVSKQVSKIIDMIDKSGVKYQLTPMGTVVETDTLPEALKIIELAYEELGDCQRVYSCLKFDIRKKSENRLQNKIKSVEDKLNREVNK
jgi:uncharacterized protein (TIGR00106 family)